MNTKNCLIENRSGEFIISDSGPKGLRVGEDVNKKLSVGYYAGRQVNLRLEPSLPQKNSLSLQYNQSSDLCA